MSDYNRIPQVRYIDNITILCNLNEQGIRLPKRVNALLDDDTYEPHEIMWFHDNEPVSSGTDLDTSVEGEFIFIGRVAGYVHDVFLSLQVGRQTDNPPSVFPESIDQFGLAKKDIQTADIETLDDYQYYKSKSPRTLLEEMHLKSLKETLADKIILARDVNHLRNAVIELEKFTLELEEEIGRINRKLQDHENRIAKLEEETVVDGKNIGSGYEIFTEKENRILKFRTLVARKPLNYALLGDTIEISIDEDALGGGEDATTGCGKIVKAKRFETCSTVSMEFDMWLADGMLAFSPYFSFQMVKIRADEGASSPTHWSLLGIYGYGRNPQFERAVRTLKTANHYIIEMKVKEGEYVGMIIGADTPSSAGGGKEELPEGGKFFKDSYSRVQRNIAEPGLNVWSFDVNRENRAGRYGMTNEADPS